MIGRFIPALLGGAHWLLACSCISSGICGTSQSADAVFAGVAERDEIVRVRGVASQVYTFAISENLRGDLPERVEVETAYGGECGAEFERGKSYLVLPQPLTGACGLTSSGAIVPLIKQRRLSITIARPGGPDRARITCSAT